MNAELHKTGEVLKFGNGVIRSNVFPQLYNDCMDLVERTAEYLDTRGRAAAKQLEPSAAKAYMTESMQLTDLMMRISALLLAWRSQKAGQMAREEFEEARDKARPPVHVLDQTIPSDLPAEFQQLVRESKDIMRRVLYVDFSLLQAIASEEE